jgi:hypothetical protein
MLFTARPAAALGALTASALLLTLAPSRAQEGGKFSIKVTKEAPPSELKGGIAKLLGPQAIELLDGSGNKVCALWLRKEVPADATAEQLQNGLTYRELKETTVVGAVRFDKDWTDIRKQKVKAGVYTLRLGRQPEDGDHAGVSPSKDFCVLVAADKDTGPATMEPKELHEKSMKSIDTGHPAALMLFAVSKAPATPQLGMVEGKYWVVNTRLPVTAAGKKGDLGVGVTLVGSPE